MLVLLAAAPLCAQELAGRAGFRARSDGGDRVNGVSVEAAFRRPAGEGARWELALGGSQMTAHRTIPGGKENVRENSIELALRLDRTLAESGNTRLSAAAGLVVSSGLGCTGGGSFEGDAGYGGVPCVNAFAKAGSITPGGEARLALELGGARNAFTVGLTAAFHTAAAGNGVSPAAFLGFRAALR